MIYFPDNYYQYTSEEYEYEMVALHRSMEKSRIRAQAELLLTKKSAVDTVEKESITTAATETHGLLTQMQGSIDTSLKGRIGIAVEDRVALHKKDYLLITDEV